MPRERKYEVPNGDEIDYAEDFAAVKADGHRPLHAHFAEWVAEKTEPSFSTAKELAAFKLGAGFGIRYRMNHQRAADGAHAFHEESRAARDAADEEKATKAAARKSAKAAPVEDEAPAPKRRGRPRKVEPVVEETPAPAPKRRGRPARAAAAETPATTAKADTGKAPATSARPARRPAASGAAPRPTRRGKGGTEPAF